MFWYFFLWRISKIVHWLDPHRRWFRYAWYGKFYYSLSRMRTPLFWIVCFANSKSKLCISLFCSHFPLSQPLSFPIPELPISVSLPHLRLSTMRMVVIISLIRNFVSQRLIKLSLFHTCNHNCSSHIWSVFLHCPLAIYSFYHHN